MCDLDFDEPAKVWDERLVSKARKEHHCDTCHATIDAGQSYISHFSVYDGLANTEKQCIRCRTIALAFQREHRWMVSPGSLLEFLDQCLDEERWNDDSDDDSNEDSEVPRNRLPSRLSDEGLRWKYAMAEIRARQST